MPGRRLAVALLAASPRVSVAGPGLCRADARGWGRRGGEEAFARALRDAAGMAGFSGVRVGIADVAVAADAAAALAVGGSRAAPDVTVRQPVAGTLIVPPGGARLFLASLPVSLLPVSEELKRTLRALGLRCIGEVAALERGELEARFGPAGARAHRWACGEDERIFASLVPGDLPQAGLELESPVVGLEPLLFLLRHLLGRVCAELATEGRCAARLLLELAPEGPGPKGARELPISPARPTGREERLFDLCRAALERTLSAGALSDPIAGLSLRVTRTAPEDVRQGDLFARGWRDPLEAAAVLSRLQARLGEEGVVRPDPRRNHRPELRNRWAPVPSGEVAGTGGASRVRARRGRAGAGGGRGEPAGEEMGEGRGAGRAR
ncbi:MAG: hypothetical protein ACE5HP_12960, partial [Gemmatimonadota bacterium]